MSALICPACEQSTMKWLSSDPNLDTSSMVCNGCRTRFKGIPGWQAAWDAKKFKVYQACLPGFEPSWWIKAPNLEAAKAYCLSQGWPVTDLMEIDVADGIDVTVNEKGEVI